MLMTVASKILISMNNYIIKKYLAIATHINIT